MASTKGSRGAELRTSVTAAQPSNVQTNDAASNWQHGYVGPTGIKLRLKLATGLHPRVWESDPPTFVSCLEAVTADLEAEADATAADSSGQLPAGLPLPEFLSTAAAWSSDVSLLDAPVSGRTRRLSSAGQLSPSGAGPPPPSSSPSAVAVPVHGQQPHVDDDDNEIVIVESGDGSGKPASNGRASRRRSGSSSSSASTAAMSSAHGFGSAVPTAPQTQGANGSSSNGHSSAAVNANDSSDAALSSSRSYPKRKRGASASSSSEAVGADNTCAHEGGGAALSRPASLQPLAIPGSSLGGGAGSGLDATSRSNVSASNHPPLFSARSVDNIRQLEDLHRQALRIDLETNPLHGTSWLTSTLIDALLFKFAQAHPDVSFLPCSFAAFELAQAVRGAPNNEQATNMYRNLAVRDVLGRPVTLTPDAIGPLVDVEGYDPLPAHAEMEHSGQEAEAAGGAMDGGVHFDDGHGGYSGSAGAAASSSSAVPVVRGAGKGLATAAVVAQTSRLQVASAAAAGTAPQPSPTSSDTSNSSSNGSNASGIRLRINYRTRNGKGGSNGGSGNGAGTPTSTSTTTMMPVLRPSPHGSRMPGLVYEDEVEDDDDDRDHAASGAAGGGNGAARTGVASSASSAAVTRVSSLQSLAKPLPSPAAALLPHVPLMQQLSMIPPAFPFPPEMMMAMAHQQQQQLQSLATSFPSMAMPMVMVPVMQPNGQQQLIPMPAHMVMSPQQVQQMHMQMQLLSPRSRAVQQQQQIIGVGAGAGPSHASSTSSSSSGFLLPGGLPLLPPTQQLYQQPTQLLQPLPFPQLVQQQLQAQQGPGQQAAPPGPEQQHQASTRAVTTTGRAASKRSDGAAVAGGAPANPMATAAASAAVSPPQWRISGSITTTLTGSSTPTAAAVTASSSSGPTAAAASARASNGPSSRTGAPQAPPSASSSAAGSTQREPWAGLLHSDRPPSSTLPLATYTSTNRPLLLFHNAGGNHWVVVRVDTGMRKRIELFEPFGKPPVSRTTVYKADGLSLRSVPRHLLAWLDAVCPLPSSMAPQGQGWKERSFSAVTSAHQDNGFDCGVACLLYAEKCGQGQEAATIRSHTDQESITGYRELLRRYLKQVAGTG